MTQDQPQAMAAIVFIETMTKLMIPNDNHLRVEVTRHFRGLFRRNSAERFVKSPSKIPSYLLDNLLTDLPKKRISSTETEFILHIFSRSGVVQGAVLLEG